MTRVNPQAKPNWLTDVSWLSVFVALLIAIVTMAAKGEPNKDWFFETVDVPLYSFPHREDDSVPVWAVGLYAALLGLVVILVETLLHTTFPAIWRVWVAVTVVLYALEGGMWCYVFTEWTKVWIAELRPDFLRRCVGDDATVPTSDPITCTGDADVVEEGRKSFPSGHSSLSVYFGMVSSLYLFWFFYHRDLKCWWARRRDSNRLLQWSSWHHRWIHQGFFLLYMGPMVMALGIVASRVKDYRHSPADVACGSLLGLFFAAFAFYRILVDLQRCGVSPFVPVDESGAETDNVPLAARSTHASMSAPARDAEGGSSGDVPACKM